jgi:hypothetical protein
MTKSAPLAVALALFISAASAQPPDPAVLQQIIGALQLQRNQALDGMVTYQVQALAELAKAKARIAELEKQIEDMKSVPQAPQAGSTDGRGAPR